ncbi:cobalamin biosynthesis protein CobG [Kitasatospora sp. GAS204B]|uniref:cobalamin biosynthesis protein CobG n=1 Tax=unclassified Kitasatospora TaxID=2633591 RepID=UPI002472F9D1|nr:cobalamin biosynthesis protein CobG [Kitasatospora sp. GAS204B]
MSPSPDAIEPAPARVGLGRDRGRDDACPGALRLHAADDGALARIRVPGGLLSVTQTLALALAAEELGDGALEATSRGNVQLRGLRADAGGELAQRLRAVGLLPSDSHERVRNIVASPLAGLDGGADLWPWLRELDTLLLASEAARELSGRFLFALDDGRGDVAALDADLTLIAHPDGALLRLGRAGAALAADGPGTVLRAAEEFVRLRSGSWRIREADPDGSLLTARLGLAPRPLPALPGTRPAVGAFGYGCCVGLRFGRATAAQWRLLAAHAPTELRVTPWRAVVLPGAGAEALPALAAAGLRTEAASAWAGATACTGSPGCAKSLADVRSHAAAALDASVALDAAAALDADAPGRLLPVHWSGCERRCGHPAGAFVDVLATGDGYRVGHAGRADEVTNQQMAAAVAAARRTT